eukprot:Selendium_serpulae@DN1466_c0_g1_i1.p2
MGVFQEAATLSLFYVTAVCAIYLVFTMMKRHETVTGDFHFCPGQMKYSTATTCNSFPFKNVSTLNFVRSGAVVSSKCGISWSGDGVADVSRRRRITEIRIKEVLRSKQPTVSVLI